MIAPFLHINGLRKVYGKVVAIDRVDLVVAEGEFMTFLGPSGSGKSTTLYIIAGFQDPTAGDVALRGRSLLSVPPYKRNIGMVFQRYTLFPHLTVGENVAFPLRVRRVPPDDIVTRVRRALTLVRLEGFEDRQPATLSGGQQQRVALARALVYNPPLLLMDEPLSALDKQLREEIQLEIRRIHRETGVTVIYVTHDQDEALRLSDRIAVFNHGRIEQIGSGEELYSNPATPFVAKFIGHSTFLRGRLTAVAEGRACLTFPDGSRVNNVLLHGTGAPGGEADLMLRPERIELCAANASPGTSLSVTVEDLTFLGSHTVVTVRTRWGALLSARLNFGHPLSGRMRHGDQLFVCWLPQNARAFARP